MTDTNTWPDPSRPGVPANPERDGWHWLQCLGAPHALPWRWLPVTPSDPTEAWGNGDGRELTVAGAARGWRYLGPCLTPAEVAAAVQAERDRMREALEYALESGCQTTYDHADDEIGAKGCCGEVSCGAHSSDCWTVKARAALASKEPT